MRTKVSYAHEAMKGAFGVAQSAWFKEMGAKLVREWGVQPLKGEDTQVEEGIIKLFADESITTADRLLSEFPNFLDTNIREEMKKREPKSLEVVLL